MTTRPPTKPLTPAEAEARLKRATFRICLGKSFEHRLGRVVDHYGTGFFVTNEPGQALALTAHHNFEGCPPDTLFVATYREKEIRLKWRPELSSEKADIAVLQLEDNPHGVTVEPLRAAFLDPDLPLPTRRNFFSGQDVVIYGYPERDRGGEGWRVDGQVDTGQTIAPSTEEDGRPPTERLIVHGSRISQLKGLSGAAVLDLGSGRVIAVQGSYNVEWVETDAGREYWEGGGDVRGSEIAQLVKEHSDLARHFDRLEVNSAAVPASLPTWLRWWRDRQALRRYRGRLQQQLQFVSFLSKADPLELDRVYLELKLHGFVPPREKTDSIPSRPGALQERSGTMEATEALLRPPPRFLVVGDPGSGKTTLARHLVFCLASRLPALVELARTWAPNPVARFVRRCGLRGLADRWTRFPVPFLLPLSHLAHGDQTLEDHLALLLAEDGFPDPRGFLESRLQTGACAVFLDALDEIMDQTGRECVARAIGRFCQRVPGNLIVVTCRIAGLDRPPLSGPGTGAEVSASGLEAEFEGFHKLELLPFGSEQVDRFIRNWFARSDGKAAGLLDALTRNDHLRWLTSNPLMLALVALVYERDTKLPERRVKLYERSAELLLEGLYRDKKLDSPPYDLATQQRALGAIAAGLHQAGFRQGGRTLLRRRLRAAFPAWETVRRDQLLDWLVGRGDLIRLESRETYAFGHFTFQEFFVARYFCAKRNLRPLLARVGNPWWREVLLLLAGLRPDPASLIEALRGRDLLMAAAALADACPAHTADFVHAAQAIVRDLRALHQAGGGRGLEAADALARIPGWGTKDYLTAQAQEETGQAALTALLALLATVDPAEAQRRWPKRGPLLQRLHRCLGSGVRELDQGILAALERLDSPLVFVPAGSFQMGAGTEKHEVTLADYWIGKYPVTNAQYARYVEETEYHWEGESRNHFTAGKERHPVVCVDWDDAVAYCRWAGLALPSEAEWEKAARGTDGRKYPWGNEWDPTRCNTDESGRQTTSSVDDYPSGVSPYGCYDMAGNVWEWTRSVYRRYPHDANDGLEAADALGEHVERGGSWYYGDCNLARCAYRLGSRPGQADEHRGFRVVASPSFSDSGLRSIEGESL